MKRNIILLVAFLGMSNLNAQDIKIVDYNGDNLIGETLIFWNPIDVVNAPGEYFEYGDFAKVINNTADSMVVDLLRHEVTTVANTGDYLCWGGECLGEQPSGVNPVWAVNLPVPILSMDTLQGFSGIKIYYNPHDNIGDATYKYEFFNKDDRNVKSSFFVRFSISTLTGLTEQELSEFGFDIYPNPAKEATKLKFKSALNFREQYVEVLDITGKKISSSTVPVGAEEINLNIENISSGVYFVRLVAEGVQVETKKIILQ